MSNVTKTYTELSTLPLGLGPGQFQIGKCSGILDNHMQCWRSADILVTVVTPTEKEGDVTEGVSSYYLCRRHAQLDQQAYESAKPVQEPVVEPEPVPVVDVKPVTASTSTFTPPPAKK
jgi:hypothetical protein